MSIISAIWSSFFGPRPQAGQVWTFRPLSADNPFAGTPHRVEVLEVRGRWVRYRFLPTGGFGDQSLRLDSFRFSYRPTRDEARDRTAPP